MDGLTKIKLMADSDDQNTAPAPAADAPASTDPNGGDASGEGQAPNQNNDQNPNPDGDGGDAGNGNGDGNQADGDGNGDGGNADDVATRRHNRTHAATRIATKNASQDGDGQQGDQGNNDGGNEIDSLKAEIADLRSREEAREDEAEINQIVADNEELKPYADRVKKLAADPSRKQVPIKSLFYEAAGDDLIKIGASRAATANANAAENQQDGTSTGNAPDGVSVKDMSTTDFQAMQEEVRNKL